MSMTLEEAIRHYEESEKMNKELAEICVYCRQMIAWLKILKKAKFEYDEAWRILTHPTPDVTYADRGRAQTILDTFRDSLGRMD